MLFLTETCDDGSDDGLGCKQGCQSGQDPWWTCLGGNKTSSSTCTPKCGDGKKVANENCDDGSNDGLGCNLAC